MDKELDKQLCEDFPLLYRDRNASMQESCMYFGLAVGNGWEPIIRNLSEKLEPIAREQYEENKSNPNAECYRCGKGKQWHWLFAAYYIIKYFFKNKKKATVIVKNRKSSYIGRLSTIKLIKWWWNYKWWKPCKKFQIPYLHAAQVKEKFGELRYYYGGCSDKDCKRVRELVSAAESLSMTTCEHCGQPGKMQPGGWMKTLCDKCQETRYDRNS